MYGLIDLQLDKFWGRWLYALNDLLDAHGILAILAPHELVWQAQTRNDALRGIPLFKIQAQTDHIRSKAARDEV